MLDLNAVEMQSAQPFILPEEWVCRISNDDRIYYQNNITKQTQWEPPIQAATTPKSPNIVVVVNTDEIKKKNQSQWRAVQANDGRIYWQNDTTKQTQWTQPKQSQQSCKTNTIASISNGDRNEDIVRRKLWDKEHIIWVLTLILTIYDFLTDMQVVGAWFDLTSICPQFKCDLASSAGVWAVFLLILSIIGFITALLLKYLDAKYVILLVSKHNFVVDSNTILLFA